MNLSSATQMLGLPSDVSSWNFSSNELFGRMYFRYLQMQYRAAKEARTFGHLEQICSEMLHLNAAVVVVYREVFTHEAATDTDAHWIVGVHRMVRSLKQRYWQNIARDQARLDELATQLVREIEEYLS